MQRIKELFKKDLMLSVSLFAALVSLFITPPSVKLIKDIDWKTLATLFMMLSVLEGFKKEHIFNPLINFAGRLKSMFTMSLFLIFSVFFSSMFVTNDVSLIIFVPLTIILFRQGGKEEYILPVISMENIAAVRGSMLTPFGSPQNLFIFAHSGVSAGYFILHMMPLWIFSGILLVLFIKHLYRKNPTEAISVTGADTTWENERKNKRISYIILFIIVIYTIVSRTTWWPLITLIVAVAVSFTDIDIIKKTDYVLLVTFLCFFIFSASITANEGIAGFLSRAVSEKEYVWGILLSQVISNVPAAIVLYPFTTNLAALLYGVDSAGLVSLIGSLASVINYRIYVREYPKGSKAFIKTFTLTSLTFFTIVVIPGWLLSFWRF
ncbi:MAG: SLC13 family permease [Eubacteriales bacterium]|nr:SLC13 family permease [Eubacteriales bacterium]